MLRIISTLLLTVVFGISAAAAAPLADADVRAERLAASAFAAQQRLQTQHWMSAKDRDEAQRLLLEGETLLAYADTHRVALSRATSQRLQAATARLQEALEARHPPAADAQPKVTLANGTVTGIVTDQQTGAPIAGVSVFAVNFSSGQSPSGAGVINNQFTSAAGTYTLTLPPGPFHIRTGNAGAALPAPGYVNQAFGGLAACSDSALCSRYSGTVVSVPDGGAVAAVNFALLRAGAISGMLTRASDGTPLTAVQISAQREDDAAFGNATSSAVPGQEGRFQINGLAPGRYRVIANIDPLSGLNSVVSGNVNCSRDDDCFTVPVSLLTVTSGAVTAGADLAAPLRSTVSGTITNDTAAALANAEVNLISEDGWSYSAVVTDIAGNYNFAQVRPGNYRLFVSAASFRSELYPNQACTSPVGCGALAVGGVISVPVAGNVSGLNLALSSGASISGQITRAAGGSTIAGIRVAAGNAALGEVGSAITNASGNYTISGLPDAVLNVWAYGLNDVTETALGGSTCPGADIGGCIGVGISVTSAVATPLTGVNIAMAAGGTISGVISDGLSGFPATANRVRAELFEVPAPGQPQPLSYTYLVLQGASGSYNLAGVAPGSYRVVFSSSGTVGWIDTSFGGQPCPRGSCDQSVLPSVLVSAGATTSGISGALPRGAIIRGRITDAASGQPVAQRQFDPAGGSNGFVAFYSGLQNYAGFGQLNRGGDYLSRTGFPVGPLFSATFLLRNNQSFGGGFVDQSYAGIACPWLSCGSTSGTPIAVTTSDVSGINYVLSQGATLAGTVRRASDSAPLESVLIQAYNAAGRKLGEVRSYPNGGYVLYGLPSGNIYLTTRNELGYLDQGFGGLNCTPFCNPVNATPVSVTAPNPTTGIDFVLASSASISGNVSDAGPAANVAVELYGAIGNFLRATTSAADGGFRFDGLGAGRYFVRSRNANGRADDLFSAVACVGTACQVQSGTPIDLNAGSNITGVQLVLSAPAVISGSITDQATGLPLSGVSLQLLAANGALALTTTSSATGTYQFSSLVTGNYYVVTRNTPTYIDEAYNNQPCPAACNGLNGTPIAVVSGATSTINMQLSQGTSISGTVRSAPSTPLAGVVVQLYNQAGVPVGQIASNTVGAFQINGLPDGNYYLRTQNSLGFVDQVYNGRSCSGYCDVQSGDPVAVVGAAPVSAVDFLLTPGGSIGGRLTSSNGGQAIALATVQAFDVNGLPAGSASSDAAGNYAIAGLRNGNYRLRTLNTAGFINQVHAGITCSPTPCSTAAGNVVVVAGGPVSGINFNLTPGGTISGTATDQFNNPLLAGNAVIYNASGIDVLSVPVINGSWEANGLANGTYYVLIENTAGLIDQLYANVPCSAGACNITALGTPIVLSSLRNNATINGNNNAGIDLALAIGRTISGRVQVSPGNTPLANATVYLFDASGSVVGEGQTNALGDFTSSGGFAAGTYYAATANGVTRGVGGGLINARYASGDCLLDCDVTGGAPINVFAANVTGINFSVRAGVGFGGAVEGATGPLAQVTVNVFDSVGQLAGSFQTNSLGRYVADGLAPGVYFARTVNNLGLRDVLYSGTFCTDGCNVLAGTPISISNASQPQSINFDLSRVSAVFGNGFE